MRFEKFISQNFPNYDVSALCIDNCASLVADGNKNLDFGIKFAEQDIIKDLLYDKFVLPKCFADLCVSFGILHHIPSKMLRRKFVETTIESVKPKKFIVLAFWQFLNDNKIKQKAQEAIVFAKSNLDLNFLDEDDYFLNWQDRKDVFRFCHHTSDEEIVELCSNPNIKVINSFSCDGRTNSLNKYIILQRLS